MHRMKNKDWKSVLFTDEKSFWLMLGNNLMIAESKNMTAIPKLHVWGAIGYYFKVIYLFSTKYGRRIISEDRSEAAST